MADSIAAKGFQIPAIFDIFMTVTGLVGICVSLHLFWSKYLPITQEKTPYGIFIGVVLAVSASFFIFGAKSWYARHKKEVNDEEKRRELDLKKKQLENKKLRNETKSKR